MARCAFPSRSRITCARSGSAERSCRPATRTPMKGPEEKRLAERWLEGRPNPRTAGRQAAAQADPARRPFRRGGQKRTAGHPRSCGCPAEGRYLMGVSGGRDSMVLLHVLLGAGGGGWWSAISITGCAASDAAADARLVGSVARQRRSCPWSSGARTCADSPKQGSCPSKPPHARHGKHFSSPWRGRGAAGRCCSPTTRTIRSRRSSSIFAGAPAQPAWRGCASGVAAAPCRAAAAPVAGRPSAARRVAARDGRYVERARSLVPRGCHEHGPRPHAQPGAARVIARAQRRFGPRGAAGHLARGGYPRRGGSVDARESARPRGGRCPSSACPGAACRRNRWPSSGGCCGPGSRRAERCGIGYEEVERVARAARPGRRGGGEDQSAGRAVRAAAGGGACSSKGRSRRADRSKRLQRANPGGGLPAARRSGATAGERQLGDAALVQFAQALVDHAVELRLGRRGERQVEAVLRGQGQRDAANPSRRGRRKKSSRARGSACPRRPSATRARPRRSRRRFRAASSGRGPAPRRAPGLRRARRC